MTIPEPIAPRAAVGTPGERAERAVAAIIADLDQGPGRGVVVDSPPGAGKSTLVVQAAGHLAAAGHQLMIVAQTNEQVDDLTDRLASEYPDLPLGRLHGTAVQLPERVVRHPQVRGSTRIQALRELPVVLSTAKKWSYVTPQTCEPWRWAIVDEAYQMRSDALLATAPLFGEPDARVLFVGDPGQLDPFSTVETDRWRGLSWDPLLNAVDVTLAHTADLARHQLPISWRLPTSAAPLVEGAFYPYSPFESGTGPGDRRLGFVTAAHSARPVDEVLARAADSGWGLLELEARHTLDHDPGVAEALAATAARLLERGALGDGLPLAEDRIAIGTARTLQAAAVRRRLAERGLTRITVDTANRLQGREFDVTLVWHPLSGRLDASAFHLEAGRLCVLLSRHRYACIVVARAGIRDVLDRHPTTRPVHLDVKPKFPDGWRAHQSVMTHLERPEHRVRAL
ncbi:AAA family ATPase [Kitasatospora nipponensis]|uniref:AAA family ATPase n=1 Tax=Kitasatospora nipponensis TaxID=258049 RepID=A0ABP4G648_9ACTN